MARITDAINQGLENLSTSPLGMASLGLLMQPSMSKEPINPWAYAAKGLEMGMQNRQLAAQQKSEAELQAMRRNEYARRIMQFNQEQQKAREEEAKMKRRESAASQYRAGLEPLQRLAFDALPLAEQAKIISAQTFPNAALGGDQPAGVQEFLFNQINPEYMEFRREMASLSPEAQAAAAYGRAFQSELGRARGGYEGRVPAAETARVIQAGKATGTMEGEQTTAARLDLPSYLDSSKAMLSKVAELIQHPGMPAAVGAPSLGKAMTLVPGTEASNFMARLEEVKGGQFLEAFNTLKGGGAITQTEGQKATQAISRMSTSQDEKEFVTAANEFMDIVRKGMERAQAKASGSAPSQAAPSRIVNFEDLP